MLEFPKWHRDFLSWKSIIDDEFQMTGSPPTCRSLTVFFCFLAVNLHAADSLEPYATEAEVPDNVIDLWKDVDFTKDPLDTEIIKEWTEDGVACRYVIFTVGTFKGAESRIAAFYTFPEGAENGAAFVWAHGGGQRADRERGKYFAKHGYATVDINWGGREMVEGIEKNTDWGNVDPTQGPQFYPGALRDKVKLNLLPDEHTIDPVVSPRNGVWFLLTYAARRAITFLEQQPEVDPEKIGFTGFSMGGNITSYAAIDPRLKAIAPMVGGSGFITSDFPGIPGSGNSRQYPGHSKLFAATMESQNYYPHVQCPVLLLNASNDFHAKFEAVYSSMSALPHDHWRVSHNMHFNHGLGPEQWILINRWFDNYLKGEDVKIAKTPASGISVDGEKGQAAFTVTPDSTTSPKNVEIFYSHDPNARTRFWITAEATEENGSWKAILPIVADLPLFAFANCTFPLENPVESFQGTATQYTITSDEAVLLPEEVDSTKLSSAATDEAVFADFESDGFAGWGFSPRGGISTYKFQDPRAKTPGADVRMKVVVRVPREKLSLRFRIQKNQFLTNVRKPQETFSAAPHPVGSGTQEILLNVADFKSREGETMNDWSNIANFTFEIYDGAAQKMLQFSDSENASIPSKIEWLRD